MRLSFRWCALADDLRVVALENLLDLGWEKVGLVKRMVCGLFRIGLGTAAEGRGLGMWIASGAMVDARRCGG